jgi:8-oxo-dGTP pyrophosphatase MutT (NUDIX family)
MDFNIFTQKDKFPDMIVEKLAAVRVDFSEKLRHIDTLRKARESYLAAGILLLLAFKTGSDARGHGEGEYVFQLIKRSDKVSQPGDLSCPGGRLNFFLDAILSRFVASALVPVMKGNALSHALKRGPDTLKAINLILANALRESWEEIGISPFNISFLGALPSYTFSPARRTIFPVAGVVKNSLPLRLNEEVEKIVDIPLKAFFDDRNFANFIIEPPLPERSNQDYPPEYPCLVYHDTDGHEEILWGATYNIIMDFLHWTLGYTQPDTIDRKKIRRPLRPDYMRYLKS